MFNLETNSDEKNQILASLPADEYGLLSPRLETVDLKINDLVIAPNAPVRHVYFPHTALGSMVANPGGNMVEAASIGREGFIGLPALFGSTSTTTTVIQIEGVAERMRVEDLLEMLPEMPALTSILRRYALSLFDQAAHSAACNRAHPIVERCAKWLMIIADRTGREQFKITHQYLATMLGVRRAGVTVAAGILQKAGAIQYARGQIRILDREKLKECACECYPVLGMITARVFETPPPRNRQRLVAGD
ncbi:MAG TPA: Crp/Fnr family transcriptional regulator [Gemmatimonadaceae bacterium]|nr:Crp/Fnr family transcriptional regulator [Gemmatimonadaceae bacterium]